MSARPLDTTALRDWSHAAVSGLVAHADEINGLNVFPVADADTGTNMLFTMRAAAERAASVDGDAGIAVVASAIAEGALQGARGNSGVILSQILRGLAEVTLDAADQTDGELADINGAVFGAALRHAVGLVVASVGETVPGTIVSVLQAAAGAAEDASDAAEDLAAVVMSASDAAVVALEKTTQQLDVLADTVATADVLATLRGAVGDPLEDVRLFDVFTSDAFGAGRRSLAFALRFRLPDRTLTDADVATLRQQAIDAVVAAHDAELRG